MYPVKLFIILQIDNNISFKVLNESFHDIFCSFPCHTYKTTYIAEIDGMYIDDKYQERYNHIWTVLAVTINFLNNKYMYI